MRVGSLFWVFAVFAAGSLFAADSLTARAAGEAVTAPLASEIVAGTANDAVDSSATVADRGLEDAAVAPVSSAGSDRQDDFARRFIRRIDGDVRVFGYRALRAALSAVGDDDASWDEEMSDLGDATADKLFQAAADSATDGLRRGLDGSFIRNLTLSYRSPFSSSGARVSGDALAALWGDADRLLFAQFGGGADFGDDGEDDDSDKYGSVGFGLRGKLGGAVLGGNIFGDVTAEGYRRHSFGLEARHRGGSLRANWYFGDAHLADGRTLEASGRVPGLTDWAEFGAEFSQWDNTADDGGDEMEAGYRLSVFPRDGVRLNFKQNKEEGESSSFEVLAEFGWHLDATGLAGAAIRLGDAGELEARLDGIVERDREFRKKTRLSAADAVLASAASASGQVGPDCGSGTADGDDSCVVSDVESSLGALVVTLVVTLHADGSCETEIDGEAAVSRRGRLLADGVNVCESAATAAEIDWSPGFGFGNATAEPRILTGTAGEAFSRNLAEEDFIDAEGELICEVAAGELPLGLVLDETACVLSGTFPAAAGLLSFTIRADEADGAAHSVVYMLNRHPTGETAITVKAVESRVFAHDAAGDFNDADGDYLTCEVKAGSSLPEWLSQGGLGGCALTGRPTTVVSAAFTLVIGDGADGRAEAGYAVSVIARNVARADETALREAARDGNVGKVTRLLTAGNADVNARDYYSSTALILAAREGHADVVNELRDVAGIDANLKNRFGNTALMLAAQNGHADVVEELRDFASIDFNLRDRNGNTALMLAAENGRDGVVDSLLDVVGISTSWENNDGNTALMLAAANGHDEVVDSLLDVVGINPSWENNDGNTALMLAAANGHDDMVDSLLDVVGINPSWENNDGNTALMLAAENGHDEVVDSLLDVADVNVNRRNDYGDTALIRSAARGHVDVVEKLLDFPRINPNLRGAYGYTALMIAALYGRANVVEKLQEVSETNVNWRGPRGNTALMLAVKYDRENVVKKLYDFPNINPNLRDYNGHNTVLIWAIQNDRANMVELLRDFPGIDPNVRNHDGVTALIWAARKGRLDIVEQLHKFLNIDPDEPDKYGSTALSWAAYENHFRVVEKLLEFTDIDANLKTRNYGRTALIWAAQRGYGRVVNILLGFPGIDANLKDNSAHTALDYANKRNLSTVRARLLAGRARCFRVCRADDIHLLAPAAPANLMETDPSSEAAGNVVLEWEGSADATGYIIYRNDTEVGREDSGDTPSWTDGFLVHGEYHYGIVAIGADGKVSERAEVKVTVHNHPPVAKNDVSRSLDAVVGLAIAERDIANDFIDADGDVLTCAVKDGAALPAGLSLGGDVGCELSGTPTAVESSVFTIEVDDSHDGMAEAVYTIEVISAETALIAEAKSGDANGEINLLLAVDNIDVNAEDSEGYTALIWAARNGHADVVDALLGFSGIPPIRTDLQNDYGYTALDLANRNNHELVRDKLIAVGAPCNRVCS